MVVFPNAKINLGLNIKYKRPDGFHELETIMFPIYLKDILEFVPAKKTSLHISGQSVGDCKPKDNLVYKAWHLLKNKKQIPAVEIYLHKNIPSGAGLGGGSADAAYTITALNEIFELSLSISEMEELAAELGSDCAFFIRNMPALAMGRGEILKPITVELKNYHLALIIPSMHISTAEAYSGVQPKKPENPIQNIISLPVKEWRKYLFNDFEPHIFNRYPDLAKIKNNLYDAGAVYASMSGSGSAMYGIFEQKPELESRSDIKSLIAEKKVSTVSTYKIKV